MTGATEAQKQQWQDKGYVVVENAYTGEDLKRLQEAFDREARAARPEWLKEVAACTKAGAFFDIPNALEKDEAFIGLADHPGYYGILKDLLGPDLLFGGIQVRTLPVSPISYVGWHPDKPHALPQHAKVQVYVNNTAENAGAFAYVPGSHKPDSGPYPVVHNLKDMPGHKVFPGKAGTAVIFNTRGWHTSMLNTTQEPRKSIIIGFSVWYERPEADRHQKIRDHLKTPERRQLFGIEPRHN